MLRRLLYLLACFCVAFVTEAHALSPIAPRLVVPPQAGDQPIQLRKLRVDAEISGGMAQTTVEMEFYNPNRRVLEGELQFPLLPGQEVIGFALDVNGRLRDAVPVEKARGQEVFEEIVRRGVDPGLLQATQGNNYKLRVYPLFAQRSRFVRIRYVEALPLQGRLHSYQHLYRLPLEYPATIGEYTLRVAVSDAAAAPRALGAPEGLVDFQRRGAALVSEGARKDFRGRGTLEIRLAAPAEARAFVQESGGRSYFVAEVPGAARSVPRALPSRIQLLWDSSASGAERKHAKEIALLDAYFRAVPAADVRLVRLRDRAEVAGVFRVARGEWQALRAALEATVYDGGTRVDDIPAEPWAEENLLFSDGLVNFGRPEIAALQVPLYTVSSALRADARWLARAAHASGGRFIDLAADAPRVAQDKLLLAEERISAVSGEGVAQLVAESPYAQGGRFLVAGEMLAKEGTLRLLLGAPGGRARELRLRVSMRSPRSSLAAVSFAKMRLAALEAEPAVHKAEIERLGRAFGLVTRNTSLIVLEFVQDYVRFRIEPPEELRAEYAQLLAQGHGRVYVPDPAQHLERIVSLYREREAWWQREYPKGTLPAPVEDRSRHLRDMEIARGGAGAVMSEAQRAPASQPMFAPSPIKPGPVARVDLARSNQLQERAKSAADAIEKRGELGMRAYSTTAVGGPYMARFRGADTDKLYRIYLDERPGHAQEAGFYLDVADILFERGLTALALRVLSNLAEIDLENRHLLRLLAYRLMQAEHWLLATPILERVHELAPEEPQSWRDLALSLGREGKTQRAVDLLNEVVIRPWDRRFPDVGLVAVAEMNALIATAPSALNTSRIDPRLLKNLPVDLRIVLGWDADQSNLDLQVQDPNGQTAMHQGQPTFQGGRLSANFAGGYGPEEFVLRQAKPGKYRISVAYRWDRRQAAGALPPVAQVRVIRNFGTAIQSERIHSVRFQRAGQQTAVGELEIQPDNAGQ
jgi:Ca-activated chloride channel homolog